MVKCSKGQVRRLKTALRWKGDLPRRQRIQMVLLRESEMMQPAIAEAMGVSLSTVNRAHMAYDGGGLKALKSKPSGGRQRENMTLAEEKALLVRLYMGRTEDVVPLFHLNSRGLATSVSRMLSVRSKFSCFLFV